MHKLEGSCHCGDVDVSIELPRAPNEYSPRVCDCDFCRKHGASYVSDRAGTLSLHVRSPSTLNRYRQGSGTAEMLVCSNCGVLVGGLYTTDVGAFAAINVRVIDGPTQFGSPQSASPKSLEVNEKMERWKSLWFRNVRIAFNEA
jgi:hypothetical protein